MYIWLFRKPLPMQVHVDAMVSIHGVMYGY